MAEVTFNKQLTALLVIDPYNDFISEGGKLWNRLKAVAEANNCIPHMLQVLNAARQAGLRVLYALHHRYARAPGTPSASSLNGLCRASVVPITRILFMSKVCPVAISIS